MHRGTALVALLLCSPLAGCGGLGSSPGGPTETVPPDLDPVSLPDRPDELTAESVSGFALACERAVVRNGAAAVDGIVGLDIGRTYGGTTDERNATFVVTLDLRGEVSYARPEPETLGLDYRVTYRVNDSVAVRVEVEGRPPNYGPIGTTDC